MPDRPRLYRKRLIPDECIPLDRDRILAMDETKIVTAWEAIRPRADLAFGYSLYLPDSGIKISRFYSHTSSFLFRYCDIIESSFNPADNSYVFTDLLIDVKVFPDGSFKILDLDEVTAAFRKGLLSEEQLLYSIDRLHYLLNCIYSGSFRDLEEMLLPYIPESLR